MHIRRWAHAGMILAAAYGLWSGQVVGDPAEQRSEWKLVQQFREVVQGQTPQQQCEAALASVLKARTSPEPMYKCEAR